MIVGQFSLGRPDDHAKAAAGVPVITTPRSAVEGL
jgi:hypothetical protein